jgi:hypothetical protein
MSNRAIATLFISVIVIAAIALVLQVYGDVSALQALDAYKSEVQQ